MLNQYLSETIYNIINLRIGNITIYDAKGNFVVSNADDNANVLDSDLLEELINASNLIVYNNAIYDWVTLNGIKVYLICFDDVENSSIDYAKEIVRLINSNITTLLSTDKQSFGKDNFFRNLILGNLDKDKISSLCYELNVPIEQNGHVLLIEYASGNRDEVVEEILISIFRNSNIIQVDNSHSVIIADFIDIDTAEIDTFIGGIVDEIRLETTETLYVGIGTKIENVFQLNRAYEDALLALKIGMIFYTNEHVFNFSKLGLAKLIYELPIDVCKKFIDDVLPGDIKTFLEDKEILKSIKVFFKSNLNISVAARDLYVHRNTLVYRLDKINKLTGYDLGNFDDAVVINTALMIKDYLNRYDASKGETNDKI